jgi:hypothetical protein
VLPGHTRTASQVMGELLTRHPEAASLQAEASHRRALACDSKLIVSETLAVEQAARLGYEELRHRLDPRRLHTVNFAAGMLVLILLSAGLTVLDTIQLSGLLGRTGSALPTLAATAVWLTGAWVTALAGREGRWPVVLVVGTAAVLLGAMLAGVDGLTRHSLVFAVLISAFILVFAGGAAVLMARMESASLPVARRRWHRARAAHEAAVKAERGDVEAAAVATEAWLGLVRASAVADADEDLARETVALAVALLESGHPRLPFPE